MSETPPHPWLHRFALLLSASTLILLSAGASVTSTGSGLAVPDWPLSFGQFFPEMKGGVLYEHGHRMIAGVVLLLTLAMTIWLYRAEERIWVKRVGLFAMISVIVQALLGGMTVLLKLPTAVSVSHAGLAQIFLCFTVTLAVVTGSQWSDNTRQLSGADGARLRGLALATTVLIYLQILVGALMRHKGAALAIPDFPLHYGHIFPPYFSGPILIHYLHRVGALIVSISVVMLMVRVFRYHRQDERIMTPALWLALLMVLQITLGAFTIWSRRAVLPTTTHVAVGAMVLAASLIVTLRSYRYSTRETAPVLAGGRTSATVSPIATSPEQG